MVRGFADGMYILFTLEGTGEIIHELERRLRVTEPVIKFITVRIDEEEKRLAKVKARRGVRRTATPAVLAAPAAAPVVAAPVATPVAAPAVVATPAPIAAEAPEVAPAV
jgi:small subunit ribosomal protein S6